jgi:hypothetical protein
MKNKIIKIKETVRRIWAIKTIILIATLVTVIVWQNFADRLPQVTWADTIVVKNEQPAETTCPKTYIECLEDEYMVSRVQEILNSPEFKAKAELEARLELNAMTLQSAQEAEEKYRLLSRKGGG